MLDGHLRGLSREAISREMGVAPATVRTYEWKACRRYGVKTLAEALECFRSAAGGAPDAGAPRKTRRRKGATERRGASGSDR